MAAYREVDSWVRAWRVPESDPAVAVPGCAGVHVQLRLDGVLIGRGQSMSAEGASCAAALARAAREAMELAQSRMLLPNDATRDAALAGYAQRVTVSLELAGPIVVFEPRTWEEAEIMLAPGLDGVAVRIVPERAAPGPIEAAFPSLMMASGALPHRTLGGLCAKVIGEGGAAAALEPPAVIRTRHALRMYRFRTTHLAQCEPGGAPMFLHRGARLIEQSEITAAELHRMAESMAAHLRRAVEGDLPHESAALAALALRRHAGGSAASDQQRASARAAEAAISKLAAKATELSEAAALLALIAESHEFGLPAPELPGPWLDRHARLSARLALGNQPPGDLLGRAPGPVRGLYALTLALYPMLATPTGSTYDQSRESARVDSSIRALLAATPQGELVAHMPWLGWAELELARRRQTADGKPADIPSAIALREMRRQVWEHAISAADADDAPDFAGGIVFTRGRSPLPTWQSVRPLVFIAAMLRDPRLTDPPERMSELVKLLEAVRFIRQLQADDSIGWMSPDPAAAVGGVRAAPWDFTLPPDATSLSLLLVTEAIRSIDALSKPAEPAPNAR